ncbi:MAG: hypothetical protein CMP08_11020 [Xanthomonadales bacterium]|nr:hypothetical protein [Xanthomonadales bacterium]|tara:strand:- start:345 stop:674 length:330 start_codon:yes stop_codon:yes gene_type:complete
MQRSGQRSKTRSIACASAELRIPSAGLSCYRYGQLNHRHNGKNTMDVNDWQSLERDDKRGFEILGREQGMGWEVEVRFDGAIEPKRDSESAKDRQEAVKVGREIAMAAL